MFNLYSNATKSITYNAKLTMVSHTSIFQTISFLTALKRNHLILISRFILKFCTSNRIKNNCQILVRIIFVFANLTITSFYISKLLHIWKFQNVKTWSSYVLTFCETNNVKIFGKIVFHHHISFPTKCLMFV